MKDSVGGKARDQKEFKDFAGSQQFFIDQGLLSLQISHEIYQFLLMKGGFRNYEQDLDLQEGAKHEIIKNILVLCRLFLSDIRINRIQPLQGHTPGPYRSSVP